MDPATIAALRAADAAISDPSLEAEYRAWWQASYGTPPCPGRRHRSGLVPPPAEQGPGMSRHRRLLCSCSLLAAAVAALIAAWPLPAGACAAGVLALASVMLAPLDPP